MMSLGNWIKELVRAELKTKEITPKGQLFIEKELV
jgi:hypothetical protein